MAETAHSDANLFPQVLLRKGGVVAEGVQIAGFGAPEAEGRWTLGSTTRLSFNVRSSDWPGGAILHLTARPFIADQHRANASIQMENGPVQPLVFRSRRRTRFAFPLTLQDAPERQITCRIHIENPISPAALQMGDDSRLLGIMISSIELRPTPSSGRRWRDWLNHVVLAWRTAFDKVTR